MQHLLWALNDYSTFVLRTHNHGIENRNTVPCKSYIINLIRTTLSFNHCIENTAIVLKTQITYLAKRAYLHCLFAQITYLAKRAYSFALHFKRVVMLYSQADVVMPKSGTLTPNLNLKPSLTPRP